MKTYIRRCKTCADGRLEIPFSPCEDCTFVRGGTRHGDKKGMDHRAMFSIVGFICFAASAFAAALFAAAHAAHAADYAAAYAYAAYAAAVGMLLTLYILGLM